MKTVRNLTRAALEDQPGPMQDVIRYLEERERTVTFTSEEISEALANASVDIAVRFEGLPAEGMAVWLARLSTELRLVEERKRHREHGTPPRCPRCHPMTRHLEAVHSKDEGDV